MTRDQAKSILAKFRQADSGVAAVEFAMVAPLLLLVFLGGFELTQAASTYRKLTDTTSQVADIVSQYTTMSSTDISAVFAATTQIISPTPTPNLKMVVSEISTDANNNATVTWSQPYNGATALIIGSPATLPAGLATPNSSYVLVQSTYLYTPSIGSTFVHNLPLHSSIYMLPRQSNNIAYTG